ncbi:MAG: hypothetical protein F6K65_23040 [Moorea sp. SIO3C2]|nr:hypothetical protein [Moorena sp. SIO3C2]
MATLREWPRYANGTLLLFNLLVNQSCQPSQPLGAVSYQLLAITYESWLKS